MTIERASELIKTITDQEKKIDLFDFFVDYFNLVDIEIIKMFAEMSGFLIATNVTIKGE